MTVKLPFYVSVDVDTVIENLKDHVHLDEILACFSADDLFAYLQRDKGDDWILEQLENRGHSEG